MKVSIKKFKIDFPDDVSGLDEIIRKDKISPSKIICIISKTTGNGELNDYSRQFTELNFISYFSQKLKITIDSIRKNITFITSSGSEGIVAPHGYLIYQKDFHNDNYKIKKGLVLGKAKSRKLTPHEIGSLEQIYLVEEATKKAYLNSGISNYKDIGVVFVKAPIVRIYNYNSKYFFDPKRSISLTRAASALGVGLALGEINRNLIKEEIIGQDLNIFSKKAFVFSGNEVEDCRVLILGNSIAGNYELIINNTIIKDLTDIENIMKIIKNDHSKNLIAVFAKVAINPNIILWGKKTSIYNTDIRSDRLIRAVASGILVSTLKNPEIFISAGAEHQGFSNGINLVTIFKNK
jgi:cyanuric acid amidohydrolase